MKQTKFGFSKELDDILTERLEKIQRECKPPWIAAFDADGTLWDTDVGEAFFDYEITNCNLPNMPDDPWQHYENLKKLDPPTAYLWLAQINEGQPWTSVQQWARISVQKHAVPVFEAQRKLIQYLLFRGFQIYIVTASVEWAVRPAATLVGLKPENVLGIKTQIKDGIVTRELDGHLTWREGKSLSLLKATGNISPVFAVGNTIGDQALIESSTQIRMAVSSRKSVGELAESEFNLKSVALKQGWITHEF